MKFEFWILGGAVPTFNQFANIPPPSSINNLPGLESVFEPRQNQLQLQQQTQMQEPLVRKYSLWWTNSKVSSDEYHWINWNFNWFFVSF